MKIVFMGTPDFAAVSLQALLNAGHEVAAVVTMEDKPVGRKRILTPPPVKLLASEHGIEVYQPKSVRTEEAYQTIAGFRPDILVVVAYGKILPKKLLDLAPYGAVNVHGSLLPKYRGAAPIHAALMNGDSVTGITTMRMDEGLDTGDILLREELPILDSDTVETLWDKMAELGAKVLLQTIDALEQNTVTPVKQPEGASYCTMISSEMGQVDFTKSAKTIWNLYRALTPNPGIYTTFRDKKLKLFCVSYTEEETAAVPGTVLCSSDVLKVACGKGCLFVGEVKPEGKKNMDIKSFINGYRLNNGDILGKRSEGGDS